MKKQRIAVIGPNPIQSNPIQSMDGSNPCPTLSHGWLSLIPLP